MDTKFAEILDSLPPKTPRSRLEPYRELIREMRRRGRTYREIAQVLGERCQVRIAPSTVQEFVIRRARSKPPASTLKEIGEQAAAEPPAKARPATTSTEVQARIQALKQRDPATDKASKPVFAYDENEPLRVRPFQPEKASS